MREETRTGKRRTALVTGASAGIGAALARVFAEHGFDTVLVARRRRHLEELAAELESACGVRARALPADLSDPAAPQRISDTLRQQGVDVDVLVNNAGYALREGFCESSWEDHAAFLQVMGISVAELCHRFLPGMKERGYGRIVNVSSLAVFAPEVAGSLYRAIKSFVVSLSEALAMELEGTGIHVTALCPGFTVTEFHDVTGTRDQFNRLPGFMIMDADTVAREGYDAVMRGRRVYVNGRVNQLLAAGLETMPRWLHRSVSKFRPTMRPVD